MGPFLCNTLELTAFDSIRSIAFLSLLNHIMKRKGMPDLVPVFIVNASKLLKKSRELDEYTEFDRHELPLMTSVLMHLSDPVICLTHKSV